MVATKFQASISAPFEFSAHVVFTFFSITTEALGFRGLLVVKRSAGGEALPFLQ